MNPRIEVLTRLVVQVFFRDLRLKTFALLVSVVLFVSTRDDVTRTFEVPLRAIPDADRVLLTRLPDTIHVKVRGPWTRINRLQDIDFEPARFDLRDASPGPLRIDEGAVVMPPGVVFSKIEYDHVDLRFEPVVTRAIDIEVPTFGAPASGYEVVRIEVEPQRWTVRGGESDVARVERLRTDPVDVTERDAGWEIRVQIRRPSGAVRLVGDDVASPRARIKVHVDPVQETRSFILQLSVPEEIDPLRMIPRTKTVTVRGPVQAFEELDALALPLPVQTELEALDAVEGARTVKISFRWGEQVPEEIIERLKIDPREETLSIPVPRELPPSNEPSPADD